jgi:hypothetical protein
MTSGTDDGYELLVVAQIASDAGVRIRNLSFLRSLPRQEYLRAIGVIHKLLQAGDVPSQWVFGMRFLFHSRFATAYFKDVYGWYREARNEDERLNFAAMAGMTFSLRWTAWAWSELQTVSPDRWPGALVRRLWGKLRDDAKFLAGVNQALESPTTPLSELYEILRIRGLPLSPKFLARTDLPPFLRRKIGGLRLPPIEAKYNQAEGHLLMTEEIDQEELSEHVTRRAAELGLQLDEPIVDGSRVLLPRTKWALFASASSLDGEVHVLVQAEDESTVKILWLSRPLKGAVV